MFLCTHTGHIRDSPFGRAYSHELTFFDCRFDLEHCYYLENVSLHSASHEPAHKSVSRLILERQYHPCNGHFFPFSIQIILCLCLVKHGRHLQQRVREVHIYPRLKFYINEFAGYVWLLGSLKVPLCSLLLQSLSTGAAVFTHSLLLCVVMVIPRVLTDSSKSFEGFKKNQLS